SRRRSRPAQGGDACRRRSRRRPRRSGPWPYSSRMEDPRAYEELRVAFTAAVSHELRTPLARLLALLESAGLDGADTPELLDQARMEVEAMSALVDDILFLSELESGREVVALGSTPALPVLEEVRDRLADRAERADVTIVLDVDAAT